MKLDEFMPLSRINVIERPLKSPDINIVKDIWLLISNEVYDWPQFQNQADLVEKIRLCIHDINQSQRHLIQNLYAGYRKRLLDVIIKKENLYNK